MKLGLQLGYWGQMPSPDWVDRAVTAEELGFTSVWTAEAWGSDAFTPLAWWGRETSRVRLGTSIVQMSGRTPTSIAMHALTLDHGWQEVAQTALDFVKRFVPAKPS